MKLVVDNSLLRATSACTRKALLSSWHQLGSPEGSVYIDAGSAAHAGLEDYLTNGDVLRAMATILGVYDDLELHVRVDRLAPRHRLRWGNVERIMRNWFESHPVESLPFEVEAAEESFKVDLADDLVLVGVRDGRVRDRQSGRRMLLENKTTGKVSNEYVRQFHTDSQQSLYLWATEQERQQFFIGKDGVYAKMHGDPFVGTFMNLIELGELPGGDDKRPGKCKSHGVAYSECGALHNGSRLEVVTREPGEMDAAARDARRLAYRYWEAAEKWPSLEDLPATTAEGKFTGECAWCEFAPVCQAGASPELAERSLGRRVWEPVPGYQPGQWLES